MTYDTQQRRYHVPAPGDLYHFPGTMRLVLSNKHVLNNSRHLWKVTWLITFVYRSDGIEAPGTIYSYWYDSDNLVDITPARVSSC